MNPNPYRRAPVSNRLGTLSDTLDRERRDQIKALVGCPKCRVGAGHGCKSPSGAYTKMHADRVYAGVRDPKFAW